MLKFNFLFAWFATCASSFVFAIFLLIFLSVGREANLSSHSYKLYSALPDHQFIATEAITSQDARPQILADFFDRYASPLSPYSKIFVAVADEYSLDYRLLPAIAMQESAGGKRVISDSFNPFGFGIYGDKVTRFSSWDEAIEKVGRTMKQNYIDQGLNTPYEIMAKYTPPSLEKGGPWAIGVSAFMDALK